MQYSTTSWNTTTTASASTTARPVLSEEQYAKRMLRKYKECAGCGEEHIHDEEDYLCWTCRGKPYIPIEIQFPKTSTNNNFFINAGWSNRQDA